MPPSEHPVIKTARFLGLAILVGFGLCRCVDVVKRVNSDQWGSMQTSVILLPSSFSHAYVIVFNEEYRIALDLLMVSSSLNSPTTFRDSLSR